MKQYLFWGILIFTLLNRASCQEACVKQDKKVIHNQKMALIYDTSKTAIITPKIIYNWLFDSKCKPAKLLQTEINEVEDIYTKCLLANRDLLLTSNKYKKQLVVVLNPKGEKEIWINCFCRVTNNNWKKEIILVDDGGNCFFSLKINLTKRVYYNLQINGDA